MDKQPKVRYRSIWQLFFVIFFFIGKFILVNMFTGIIVESFLNHKNKASFYIF